MTGGVKTVEVPGQTVVVEKEVIKTVEVPGETVVVEKEVVKIVEVPGPERVVVATPAPSMMAPTGTLNIGFKELGPYSVSPRLTPVARSRNTLQQPATKTLFRITPDRESAPKLAEEWSVDSTGTVWNFKLNEGVQFHGGWGEVTTDDVIFSVNELVAEDSINSLAGITKRIYFAEGGGITKIDDYRFEVDTVTPNFDMLYFGTVVPSAHQTVSKKQFEQEGEEAARFTGAGTGAWEFAGEEPGQNWSFDAVLDHYRKTPEFAKLVMWSIPEEATRVSNFQVGKLDSFQMKLDSKPALDELVDTRYMSVANGASEHLGLWGNFYVGMGEADFAERRPGAAKCLAEGSCPWVSSDPDPNSAEWERARKVREALSIAIDRELIVETLLGGEGTSSVSVALGESDTAAGPRSQDHRVQSQSGPSSFWKKLATQTASPSPWRQASAVFRRNQRPARPSPRCGRTSVSTPKSRGSPTQPSALSLWLGNSMEPTATAPTGGCTPWTSSMLYWQARPVLVAAPIIPSLTICSTEAPQIDDEGRWRVMNQLARFVYENVHGDGAVHRQYSVASFPGLSLGRSTWSTAPSGPLAPTNGQNTEAGKHLPVGSNAQALILAQKSSGGLVPYRYSFVSARRQQR